MNPAERHMLKVWWIRAVAMATGYDESYVAVLANVEQFTRDAVADAMTAAAWNEWAEAAS